MNHDVVVVGGGIVGSALAYELACLGISTAVIDRRDPGRASDAGAGILSPATTWRTDDVWYPFAREAGSHIETLAERLISDGASDPGYSRSGLLTVAISEGDEPFFDDLAAATLARGAGAAEEISISDARSMMPVLGEIRRALHTPGAARVDGRSITGALQEGALKQGAEWIDDDVVDLVGDAGRVSGVRTASAGVLSAGSVVIAGGAWTGSFAVRLGVAIPISPVKGQIVHLGDIAEDTASWPIVQPVLGHYLVPWPDHRVACGGTFENDAGFDGRVTASGTRELLRECLRLAPGLGAATLGDVRVGFRPFCDDDRPVCGAVPGWENVFIDSGHGADGLLAGPYCGALLAASMFGQDASLSGAGRRALEAFAPMRFHR